MRGHEGNINSVAWSPDGEFIATASGDTTVRIWKGDSGAPVHVLRGHSDFAFVVAWSPNRATLASGSWDGTIREWDPSSGRTIKVFGGRSSAISSISFSWDGRFLASKTEADTVQLWEFETGRMVTLLPEPSSPRHSPSLAFNPTQPILATLGERGLVIRIWELDFSMLLSPVDREKRSYRNAKIVLIGDSGVGKTALSMVLTNQQFLPTSSTHGRNIATFYKGEVRLTEGQSETREIVLWDTAGQPGYRLIHQLHFHEAAVAVIVFDARSETDPFSGVRHWKRALNERASRNPGAPVTTFLVAARTDRGGIAVTRDRLNAFIHEHGFDRYFETSAMENRGVQELAAAIRDAIDWQHVPRVFSDDLFYRVKGFVDRERMGGRRLSPAGDLYRSFCPNSDSGGDSESRIEFDHCIGFLENQRLVRRLNFGSLVLLRPELLDSYAAAMIEAAKMEPDGLGSILENRVLDGSFYIPESERIDHRGEEKLLLIATLQELLQYEVAFREATESGIYIVFPAQSTRERADAPDIPGSSVIFTFEGPLQSIYATLAVRFGRSSLFIKREMWKNAATFDPAVGGNCGIHLRELNEGEGEISLFFDGAASEATRYQFENYVETHLLRRAVPGSLHRRRQVFCPNCGVRFSDEMIQLRRNRGYTNLDCPVCGSSKISLLDREERLKAIPAEIVTEMDRAADSRRDLDTATTILAGKMEAEDFDVFLCHNSSDKESVKEIGERLKEHGILPWLDEWNLIPGRSWQRGLQKQIQKIRSAAVFVGGNGLGPWQEEEAEAFLNEFVGTNRPVIPVLLANAPTKPELPVFLRTRTWVDFRKYNPDPIRQLIWGITGDRRQLSST